jgi:hypothetical protein
MKRSTWGPAQDTGTRTTLPRSPSKEFTLNEKKLRPESMLAKCTWPDVDAMMQQDAALSCVCMPDDPQHIHKSCSSAPTFQVTAQLSRGLFECGHGEVTLGVISSSRLPLRTCMFAYSSGEELSAGLTAVLHCSHHTLTAATGPPTPGLPVPASPRHTWSEPASPQISAHYQVLSPATYELHARESRLQLCQHLSVLELRAAARCIELAYNSSSSSSSRSSLNGGT